MGTNFYWTHPDVPETKEFDLPNGAVLTVRPDYSDDPTYHIGKRSAAGMYCWDCRKTLCANGEAAIHFSERNEKWHDACPKCGKKYVQPESPWDSAGGVELGFTQPKKVKPTGVQTVASFSWAQDPNITRQLCQTNADRKVVADEYGHKYTGQEFLDMLECNCPIEYMT